MINIYDLCALVEPEILHKVIALTIASTPLRSFFPSRVAVLWPLFFRNFIFDYYPNK